MATFTGTTFSNNLGIPVAKPKTNSSLFVQLQHMMQQPIVIPVHHNPVHHNPVHHNPVHHNPVHHTHQNPANPLPCKHNTCWDIYKAANKQPFVDKIGVGILVVNHYEVKKSGVLHGKKWVALLGKERYGQYAGQFSIIGGKLDSGDNGCLLHAMKREMKEESKIVLSWPEIDTKFKDSNGKFRYIIHHGTPVFIGLFNGQSRKPLNDTINKHNGDVTRQPCEQELSSVEWFELQTGNQLENQPVIVSDYASAVMKKFKVSMI